MYGIRVIGIAPGATADTPGFTKLIGGMNNTSSDSNKCDGDNLNKEEVSTEETFLNAETIIIENTLDQEGATLDTIIMEPSSEE